MGILKIKHYHLGVRALLNNIVKHWSQVSVVVLGWAITPIIGSFLVDKEHQFSPFQLSYFRYLFAAIALYIILIFQKNFQIKEIINLIRKKYLKFILVSFISASMPVLLFYSVIWTTASAASFLLNMNTVIIPILAYIFLKEKIKTIQGIGIGLTVAGSFFIIFEKNFSNLLSLQAGSVTPLSILGNLLAFSSGALWAFYTILLKKFFKEDNPMIVTSTNMLFASFILLPFAIFIQPVNLQASTIFGWFLVILIAVISTSLAFSFWLSILRYLGATETGIIQVLVPVFSALLAIIFLSEKLSVIFGVGAILVVTGMMLVQQKISIQANSS